MSTYPIVLASRSPRRLELLRNAGLEPIVVVSDTEEVWRASEDAMTYAARVAREKLHATASEHQSSLPPRARLLAADTTVWIPGTPKPLGKPEDRNAARRGLMQLFAAKEHAVTTAFCIGALGQHGLEILS